MTNETPAQRLGRLVRARRKSLRLTQVDVQELGGPSTATLRLIEGGKHSDFRDGTGAALESALQWLTGSIDEVLRGGDPTPTRTSHYREDAGLMVKESEALASLRAEWAPTAGERQRVARADRSERLAAWVNLSFRADDVDAAIPAFAPEPDDDPSDIETYLDEVGGLINAAEELTDAVHEAVLEAFGGDVARLRQMKRDVRRANLAKQGLHENQVLPGFDEDDDPPQRSPRPMVILSLTGPDKGGLRVVTHEESKSIPRETYEIVCAFEPGASDEAALAAARTILRSRDPDKAYRPDNSPVDEAPPLEFRDAARSTPTGYLKGKSDQGEPPDGA